MAEPELSLDSKDNLVRLLNGLPSSTENPELDDNASEISNIREMEEEFEPIQDTNAISIAMGLEGDRITISSNGRNKVQVDEVQEHLMMPDYPDTKDGDIGIVHFVHCENPIEDSITDLGPEQGEKKLCEAFSRLVSTIQFSMKHTGRPSKTKLPLLRRLDTDDNTNQVWHRTYTCSGVKWCASRPRYFSYPEEEYCRVRPSFFHNLQQRTNKLQYYDPITETDRIVQEKTTEFYQAFLYNWTRDLGCLHPQSSLKTCQNQQPAVFSRNQASFIGCPCNSDLEPWHKATPIRFSSNVDTQYLSKLCQEGFQISDGYCTFLASTRARQKYCDRYHNNNRSNVEQSWACHARWEFYIPINWARFPFVIMVARKRHAHPPPPPSRIPAKMAEEVYNSLKRYDCLDLTAKRFLLSPEWTRLHDRFGASALRYLHKALNVEDRITALIRKERLLYYPLGTSLAGVLREYEYDQKKPYDNWIRNITFLDEAKEHFIIICCTDKQAQALTKVHILEMDLSFKMVNGNTNVFTLSSWDNERKKIMVYAYVFMNIETREAYHQMFHSLFNTLSEVAREPIRFTHIHNTGIRAVVVDMCMKQAPGFGDFLHDLDESRQWSEHLLHILIFCKVHVMRNFRKKFGDHVLKHHLHLLWEVNTREDMLYGIESLKNLCQDEKLHRWLNHKLTPWILGGLCRGQSKIPYQWWILAREHTNAGEASHFQDNNFTGRKQSLLAAVLKCRKHSEEMFARTDFRTETGVRSSWRNDSNVLRTAGTMRKNDKKQKKAADRRQKQPKRPFNPTNPYDTPFYSASPDDNDTVSMHSSVSQRESRAPSVSQSVVSDYRPSTPSHLKRHIRQESVESPDAREQQSRLRHLQRARDELLQRKELALLRKELMELEQPTPLLDTQGQQVSSLPDYIKERPISRQDEEVSPQATSESRDRVFGFIRRWF